MPSPIIPGLRYDDAVAAIGFLCEAFGFERHAVYADDADPALIHHAQLTFGEGMIMLGSARPDETQRLYGWKTPAEAGGNTLSLYVYVADPDTHCAKARAAGPRSRPSRTTMRAIPDGATPHAIPRATSGASAVMIPSQGKRGSGTCTAGRAPSMTVSPLLDYGPDVSDLPID